MKRRERDVVVRSSGYLERRRSAINFVNFVVQFPAAPSKQSISTIQSKSTNQQTADTRVSRHNANSSCTLESFDISIEE